MMPKHISQNFVFGISILLLDLYLTNANTSPCQNYTALNSTTLQGNVSQFGWYRFEDTPSGLLASSCPDEDVCSNPNGVIWINDTNAEANQTNIIICIKRDTQCCVEENVIDARRCNGYVVYYLPPSHEAEFCFNNSEVLPTNSTTTESDTIQMSSTTMLPTTSSPAVTVITHSRHLTVDSPQNDADDDDSRKQLIIAIVVVVIVVLLVAFIALMYVLRGKKTHSVSLEADRNVKMRDK